ncbi:MAG: ChrR family anti-sigma-E factor [Myxococcota bacterium]
MSLPQHHLPDDLLMAYAAGTTNEAQSLLVATHLTYCPRCRERVAEFETLGGTLLIEGEPLTVSEDLMSRTMNALNEETFPTRQETVSQSELADGVNWPRPLQPYVRGRRWKRVLPAVESIELPLSWDGEPLRAFRLRPKFKVPRHTHTADEYQIVLRGGFQDMGEHYAPGDVAVRHSSHEHELFIDDGEPCITLNVLSAPLIPKTLLGRLFRLLAGM